MPNEIFCNLIGKSIGLRPPQIFPNLKVRVQIKLQFYENMEFDKRMLITNHGHVHWYVDRMSELCVALCIMESLLKSHQRTIWNQLERRQCRVISVLWKDQNLFLAFLKSVRLISRKHGSGILWEVLCLFNFLCLQISASIGRKCRNPEKTPLAPLGCYVVCVI